MITIISPDLDAWGDGGHALYHEDRFVAETELSVTQLHDLIPELAVDDLLARTSVLIADLIGRIDCTQITYSSEWLGHVGAFPDALGDVVPAAAEE